MQGLEPLFQELRIRKVWSHIPPGGVLIDFGCDQELTLIKRLKKQMKQVIGLDLVAQPFVSGNLSVTRADLEKKLPLRSTSADVVTMLAVLEHLKRPQRAVQEAHRVLRPGGVFLVTVPSPHSQTLLPWLARMGVVRQEMVDQHEHYFTPWQLKQLALTAGFRDVTVETWEWGYNTFMKATK